MKRPPEQNPGVRVGDVFRLAEPDYRFGVGTIRLRVTHVGSTWLIDGEPWINLRGMELRADGSDFGMRYALVRVAALSAARIAPG